MIKLPRKAKINIKWEVSPYDYSKELSVKLQAKVACKYGIPRDKVKITPKFKIDGIDGEPLSSEVVENIQDPQFQIKLFKEYIKNNSIADCDFDLIQSIDAELNSLIDYQVYDKFRRFSVKWVKWSNFLSYGDDNFIDFTKLKGLTSISGQNQVGKTTISIDLIHFLLFGKTQKASTQDKIFNKHRPNETHVYVEGCIEIDGVEYIIRRTLTKNPPRKKDAKVVATQRVEYYKIVDSKEEALLDYIENKTEGDTAKTNKAIKDAIGIEDDFDLIMSVTEGTLDDLVNKKESERGRLLSRWIGLLPLEEKEEKAKERFKTVVKPNLMCTRYDEEELKKEIESFELTTASLKGEIAKYDSENKALDIEIDRLEKTKHALMASKRNIDESLLKVDITTLEANIANTITEGKRKAFEIGEIEEELKMIGNVEFSVEEYDKIQDQLSQKNLEIGSIRGKYASTKKMIEDLKSSEICPTCGRKLDGVDNSAKIAELEEELASIEDTGNALRDASKALESMINAQRDSREAYTKKSRLEVKKAALEVNVERLRNEYKELASTKKEYLRNRESIDKNNAIDIELRNTDVYLKDKRAVKDTNTAYIAASKENIKQYVAHVKDRRDAIEKIHEDEKYARAWKIYLDMVGRNGIIKMVLRKTLPIINARLAQMLDDVCDFDVEVMMNNKNEVMFYLVKDGVYSDLSSGSGFELTASGIALRAVLSEMSTIPKCDILTYDEVWGRVAKDNLENMRKLLEKISEKYSTSSRCIGLHSAPVHLAFTPT